MSVESIVSSREQRISDNLNQAKTRQKIGQFEGKFDRGTVKRGFEQMISI